MSPLRARVDNKPFLRPRDLALFGIAGVLAGLAAPGCSGKSGSNGKDDGPSGNGGTSTSGGSSSGGSSSGTGPTGGASGDSTGATSGSGGTDAVGGGAGEPGGGTSGAMGGVSGTGSGMGGADAGEGGSSGSGAAGMTGTLGERCSPRGALACAGNYQKLTVLCGGDDTWQPNQTCDTGEFCDSTPGPNAGTCQPVTPGCEDGPGTAWCAEDDKNLVTCGPDAVTTTSAPCPRACHDGECRDDVDECPVWDDYEVDVACSTDCGPTSVPCNIDSGTGCLLTGVSAFPGVVRTPWANETCVNGDCALLGILVSTSSAFVRVTVSPPWRIGACRSTPRQCFAGPLDTSNLVAVTAPAGSGPANVVIEGFDTEPTCPP